jgi:excisionase family DNA binding protein
VTDYISISEAAQLLGRNYWYTRDLALRGRLEAVRVGGHLVVNAKSVERFRRETRAARTVAA